MINSMGNQVDQSLLYSTYFDPGHKQKRGSQLGKDRSAIEAYLGLHPSFAVKLNFIKTIVLHTSKFGFPEYELLKSLN